MRPTWPPLRRSLRNSSKKGSLPSMYERSSELFRRSQEVIPGGVNSPVRAFRAVGGTPLFFREGRGAWLTDEDGRRYVDYVGSWGPLILGHADAEVLAAVNAAA